MRETYQRSDQRGMASLMVTTVLILVIALIIIGFSQVVRRNQRETLNRQLSTQAFYAAESGVDKTVAIIRDKVANNTLPADKTDCAPDLQYPAIVLDTQNVEITCVLVSSQLSTLVYSGIVENTPQVVPLISSTGVPIAQITLTWRSEDGGATPTQTCTTSTDTSYVLSTRSSWTCGHGILRTDLATQPTGTITTAMSSFFYPKRSPSPTVTQANAPAVSLGSGGGLVRGYCSDAGNDPKCMVKIDGLSASTYYLNLRSIYHNSSVTINGQDAAGNTIEFKGQALIDVTARAQDTLRRIQVRVPLNSQDTSNLPGYAIETAGSLCKRFSVQPGYYSLDTSVTCN